MIFLISSQSQPRQLLVLATAMPSSMPTHHFDAYELKQIKRIQDAKAAIKRESTPEQWKEFQAINASAAKQIVRIQNQQQQFDDSLYRSRVYDESLNLLFMGSVTVVIILAMVVSLRKKSTRKPVVLALKDNRLRIAVALTLGVISCAASIAAYRFNRETLGPVVTGIAALAWFPVLRNAALVGWKRAHASVGATSEPLLVFPSRIILAADRNALFVLFIAIGLGILIIAFVLAYHSGLIFSHVHGPDVRMPSPPGF